MIKNSIINGYIEIPLHVLHRLLSDFNNAGYSSEDIARKFNLKKDWYDWVEIWLQYPKIPYISVNNEDFEWIKSFGITFKYRINLGLKIIDDLLKGRLNKTEAIERAIMIIEHDNGDYNRLGAVKTLTQLDINRKRMFQILENLMISDEDQNIRCEAMNAMMRIFKDSEYVKILKWVIKFDVSEKMFDLLQEITKLKGKTFKLQLEPEFSSRIERIKRINERAKEIDDNFYGNFRVLIMD